LSAKRAQKKNKVVRDGGPDGRPRGFEKAKKSRTCPGPLTPSLFPQNHPPLTLPSFPIGGKKMTLLKIKNTKTPQE